MQEKSLYLSLLADLTDQEMCEVLCSEINRRNKYGLMVIVPKKDGEISASSTSPWDVPLYDQIIHFAALVGTTADAKTEQKWDVQKDDGKMGAA